ncbi:TPA: glycoside hydrolase family 19 protein [Klebsiella aerogenes]|uniref:Lytic enzyme n=1 Tax=Klebsiella aerogenes (strain ATCC 13048 / DSM 30053 / CCUG 1429 / JCM 1235 / KCTC 2190 / NBRC 13534 / NCIMB 10102 / NCTC 10006 / CDC 819-56) TaxID=1028307 RepID=A0A0H3FTN8_KLEAK|nr:glycoside hydrolase family 19 protein [Klebsiella aerogenes]AEG99130.1 lytic enzyme [Klebsiella aerogenes KCTC 2190]EKU6158229.1 glycoside hydrolase family 19 protein [Klebsiella aerogenes]MEC4761185.1 glycoside hydrolase family 19 protein [Klebsiella aerogenes]QEU18080.1 glycoside hydrolase family 19 protein [Klebsiella aerogenes]QXB08119.1 glycoside hydrolase family 19 protein [Klebsiella aerogenes]
MNQSQFQKAAGIGAGLTARWFPHITAAMKEFGITAPLDQAMFIAQMGHESGGFTRLVENLNYAADSLVPTFGKHRITAQQAAALGRTATQPADQRAIANLVYGGEWGKKNLGNQVAGDGWKYRGRGLKQITGVSNYRKCGLALKLDLVTQPELLEQDENAARSAAWFFATSGCLVYSGDVERITIIINGGKNGLDDRRRRFNLAKAVLV